MKKVLFVLAFASVLVACGPSASSEVATQDSTVVNQDSVAVADSSVTANGGGGDIKRNEALDVK